MKSFRIFIETTESPIIFIDLDSTLVRTSFRPEWAEMLLSGEDRFETLRNIRLKFLSFTAGEQMATMKKLGGIEINEDAVTFERPGARDFLISCMGIARTSILTQGRCDFQARVVKKLDLPVQELFGNLSRHSVDYGSKIPQSSKAILIDDMNQNSLLVQRKLKAIGLPKDSDRFIKINAWDGRDKKNDAFDSIFKNIRNLVKT